MIQIRRRFSTICIMAGNSSNDQRASRIMKKIKSFEPETRFVGLGGPRMMEEGLNADNNYSNPEIFLDNAF